MENLFMLILFFLFVGPIFATLISSYYLDKRNRRKKMNKIKIGDYYEKTYETSNPFEEKTTFLVKILDIKENKKGVKHIKYVHRDGSQGTDKLEYFVNEWNRSDKSF